LPGEVLDAPYGMPNTWMFQTQPSTRLMTQCPAGQVCCDFLLAQTPHPSGMPIAMGDGSVRIAASSIDLQSWSYLMLPQDGQPITENPD